MNIIIFRTDKLGDMIVSSAVIPAIRARHPEARIMVVASPYNVVAIAGHPLVDEFLIYNNDAGLAEKMVALQKMRAFSPTHALVLSPKTHCYVLAALCGAKIRGGLLMEYRLLPRLLAPLLLTHSILVPRDRENAHLAKTSTTLANRMGCAAEGDFPYLIAETPAARSQAKARLETAGIKGPYLITHLADKWIEGGWQPEDARRILKEMAARSGLPLLATAGPADKIVSVALEADFSPLRGLSFHEWVALIGMARAVVAPDCGAVHIASALQRPLLALYPPSRMRIAMNEFGPHGTVFTARALDETARTTDILCNDLSTLLDRTA